MPVKLMNQGQRTIKFGKTAEETFPPKTVAVFNEKTAKVLLDLHPGEVIDVDNLSVSYDQTKVHDFTATGGKASKKKAAEKNAAEKEPTEDEKLAKALQDEKEE